MSISSETRRESYHAVLPAVTIRQEEILKILSDGGAMSAQEVADELHRRGLTPSDERNHAAPRITELKESGKVRAVGKKICNKTGRSVTVWAVGKEVT